MDATVKVSDVHFHIVVVIRAPHPDIHCFHPSDKGYGVSFQFAGLIFDHRNEFQIVIAGSVKGRLNSENSKIEVIKIRAIERFRPSSTVTPKYLKLYFDHKSLSNLFLFHHAHRNGCPDNRICLTTTRPATPRHHVPVLIQG